MAPEGNIKYYPQLIRIALFAVFIFLFHRFVLEQVDAVRILNALKQSNIFYLCGALIFMGLRFLALAFKFRFAANSMAIQSGATGFILFEFKLLFMEFIIPVPNAEDLFRTLFLKLKHIPSAKCLNVILAMRVSGMITMAFLLIGLLFYTGTVIVQYKARVVLPILLLALLLLFTHRIWLRKLADHLKKPGWLHNLLQKVALDNIRTGKYATLITISLLHYLCSALVVYFLLRSFETELSFLIILTIVPVMALSFLIPLSIQGLGLPEAALLFMLIKLNIPEEVATVISIVHLLFYIIFILLGGFLFFFDKTYNLDFIKRQIAAIKQRL